ncbi:MAG: DNA alkylation repair protein [Clostridium sp.]|nr:DNA alkylation repair protein [Clostridium sp.]
MDQSSIRERYKARLKDLADPQYREFHSRLLPGVEGVLGVRTPDLRKLSGELLKDDWQTYIREVSDAWKLHGQGERGVCHDEIILWALSVCGGCKTWDTAKAYVEEFIPAINNWASCDLFCSSLKLARKYRSEVWEFIQPYLRSDKEYELRFGVVMLLSHFAEEAYVNRALAAVDEIRHQGYYVKMAVAWAVSVYFIKCQEPTMNYLKNNRLDQWTYNKALQKITESFRVDQETKGLIRSMKRPAART